MRYKILQIYFKKAILKMLKMTINRPITLTFNFILFSQTFLSRPIMNERSSAVYQNLSWTFS